VKLVIPNREKLSPDVRDALDALVATINQTWAVANDPNGERVRWVFVASHNTTQTLSTATWTAVEFNGEEDLRGVVGVSVPQGMHSTTTRPDRFLVPEGYAGRVRVRAAIGFAANATGSRGVRITKNGSDQRGGYVFTAAATAVGNTFLQVTWTGTVAVGDTLGVEAYQNSGGNLAIGNASTTAQNTVEIEFL
jgi:hypothetical protein